MMFLYWGRRGFSRFVYDLGRAARTEPNLNVTISVTRHNEDYNILRQAGFNLFPIDTFSTDIGALTRAWRIPRLQRQLLERLRQDQTQLVVSLMTHVWTPLIAPIFRRSGVPFICVVHDADAHPGDRTAFAKVMTDRALRLADHVLVLSEFVANRLVSSGQVPRSKLSVLFHPDLGFGAHSRLSRRRMSQPMRLLFLGRIMRYKGLPLFLDAVEILRSKGIAVDAGVFGEGKLGTCARRIAKLGVELINRWLSGPEISDIMSRFDVLVASHVEASQSGVVAAALGARMPVVVTPVGGLVEQVTNGITGLVADRADGFAIADAIIQLSCPHLYNSICEGIVRTSDERSMERFVRECCKLVDQICTDRVIG
jgi:glycosyltransferase involved in cell wall biosynthesis